MKVALNGFGDIATGLGAEARWLWNMLPFDTRIVAEHPQLGWGTWSDMGRPVVRLGEGHALPEGIDIVVSIERVVPPGTAERVFPRKLVVLANPESAGAIADWSNHVDLVVSRTAQCQRHLLTMGIASPLLNIPVDADEFPFQERASTQHVVFSNGWGGTCQRKGWPVVQQMLALDPDCVRVYSQRPIPGVPHRGEVATSRDLYRAADVMLVPSRFEGIGLTILEAMASGALVVTTDAEPMNEFVKAAYGEDAHLFLLPVASTEEIVISHQAWPAQNVDPVGALAVLERVRSLSPALIRKLSRRGREYIVGCHGHAAAMQLWDTIRRVGE